MNYRHLAFLPIPVLLILIFILHYNFGTSVFYDPPWLIPVMNILFVTITSFIMSAVAMNNFRSTGRIQILLLGCGVLSLGTGGMIAAFIRGLPDCINLNLTIYNSGALIGSLFHFAAALILISGASARFRLKQKNLWLTGGYLGVLILITLLTLAGFKGIAPAFFIQGKGHTLLRQVVVGTASIIFTFSFLVFFSVYKKNKEAFTYWYSLALGLTFISLIASFIQRSIGSPVEWAAIVSQYIAGVYFFIAILAAAYNAGDKKISFDNVITASLLPLKGKFKLLADNLPDIVIRFDRGLKYAYMNHAGLSMRGKPANSLIGRTMEETGVPEPYSTLYRDRIQEVFRAGHVLETEDYFPARDGLRYYQIRCIPEAGVDNSVESVLVIAHDMTEFKRARDLGHGLIAINNIIHSTPDIDTIMNQVISEAAKILGSETAALSLKTADSWVVSYAYGFSEKIVGVQMNDQEEPHAVLAINTGKVVTIDDAYIDERVNREHMKKWSVRSVMVVPVISNDRAVGVIFFNYHNSVYSFSEMDIDFGYKLASSVSLALQNADLLRKLQLELDERKRVEQELRRLNETLEQRVEERTELAESRSKQLQALAVELIAAEENERRRISYLLHEDLQQILAGARMQLDAASRSEIPDPILANVGRLLEESINKSRRLSLELSPAMLHFSGLGSILEWLAKQMKEQYNLDVELKIGSVPEKDSMPLRVFIFRALQELLLNVVKHSGVKTCIVALSVSGNDISVTVSDSGRGFDPALMDSRPVYASLGLLSLRERASYLGGIIKIESTSGHGTSIMLTVPINLHIAGEV